MIVEMFVKAKSEPDVSDNVEHVIASLPVTVKLIDADDDVAAVRARVTVGAVVSGNVVVVVEEEVVVVSLLPELLLGATVVVTDGVTTVVEVVVVEDEVVVEDVVVVEDEVVVEDVVVVEEAPSDAGVANHFTVVFSHQHLPVRGHRNTPESLSAQPKTSLPIFGFKRRVPLNGHLPT